MKLNRRDFLEVFGTAIALSVAPISVLGASSPKVVIIGGGFAGSTLARYLRQWSKNTIDVTLIDPSAGHTSCVMSNLVLNGQLSIEQLTFPHSKLSDVGVNVVQNRVSQILGNSKRVVLENGSSLPYDRLVIATGIGFKELPGTDFNLTPHAWIAGPQTTLLAQQVNNLEHDSTFVMTIPKSPYRCPPGPYERACLVADIIKRKGFEGGDAKVIVLDENTGIQAERHTFERAFNGIYRNIIEYVPGSEIQAIDSSSKRIVASTGEYTADVMNYIPRNRATQMVIRSGISDGGDWAEVNPLTYESLSSDFSGVHVIGDSQATKQPKSAHMANAQAKICADAIIRSFTGVSNYAMERIENITSNSACYSPITYDKASWLTANYAYDLSSNEMRATHVGEAEKWSKGNYREMFKWAENLFNDSFASRLNN